ncbi:MAG: eukaryotic-like serine/threonine-protein kinase [Thermoplasmata archaeon]|jgi:hypothetical protein|nr:eukaryotic-like serine/threonine-protein kinase [Thermoplasmata archaeon]
MEPGFALLLLGSVPLVLLGVALLALPGRRPDTRLLGAFLVAWAGGALVANLADDPIRASLGSAVLFIAAGVLVLAFAVRSSRHARLWPWLAAYAGYLALTLAASAATGSSLPETFSIAGSTYFAAFGAAIFVVYGQHQRAEPGSQRRRYRDLLVALVLFPAYVGALGSFTYLGQGGVRVVEFVVPLGAVVGIFAHALLRPPRPEGRDPLLLAVLVAPTLLGLVTALTDSASEFGLSGAARLGTALLLAYAIARRHLFDVEVRLKRLVGPTVALLALGYGIIASLAARAWWPAAVGAGVAMMAYAARRDLGRLVVRAPTGEEGYARARKLEVYRAGLEAALASGLGAEAPELQRLRRGFGISAEEHAALLASAATATRGGTTTPRTILGRYRIDRLLGEGAHGRTHLARDLRTGEQVALKTMAPSLAAEEAAMLRKVAHPNVVRALDAGEEGDQGVLVMDYAPGGNLQGLLRRRAPLPREEAARIMAGVLDGLAACHAAGVVHLDVKPENVLLGEQGEPKLADFGIARAMRLDATGLTGGGAGTLLSMSPEQVRGAHADARSDLYAAAALFHQMLTRRHYLRIAGRDDFQIRAMILQGDPEIAMPADLEDVEPFLRVGLAKDPSQRYQSAGEMRRALAGLVRLREPLAPAASGPEVPA